MHSRQLGTTGASISEVGLGTWQLGSADWGDVGEQQALAILHRSYESGVNFFDTADVYGMGTSERVIGKFLREVGSDNVLVATKLGRRGDDGNGWPANFTLGKMREHTQQSLKNLGVDSIFLQQLHCIDPDALRSGEVFDNLRSLKTEGLIQHWGVSVESVEEGLLCMQQNDCAALQVIFNIFRQKIADELLPVAAEKNVGILARVPLASGLLSGKMTRDTSFSASDHRSYNANGEKFNVGETFAGLPFETGVAAAEKVKAALGDRISDDASMAQLALRWILDHPAVSTVIPGATRLEQATANPLASDLQPLGDDVHKKLRTIYEQDVQPSIRGPY